MQVGTHRCDAIEFQRGEVVFLAWVFRQIVEMGAAILVAFDEFIVAGTDGAPGETALIGIVGVVPVEGGATELSCGILERGNERLAIEVLLRFSGEPRELEKGGIEVGGCDRLVASDARFGHAWGGDHVGLADAPFIEPTLATAEGQVGGGTSFGGGESTVVRHEDHDGVLRQIVLVEGIEHLPNGIVHRFHHGAVNGVALSDPYPAGAAMGSDLLFLSKLGRVFDGGKFGSLLPILGDELFLALQRRVDGVEGEVEEEGFVFVFGDERSGIASKAFGEVLALGTILEPGIAIG